MLAFAGWQNFYVIVGSSAGALIGLQFVVITLMAEMPLEPGVELAGSAFATPTIVHFGTVLLLSALLCAPWHTVAAGAIVWGLIGLIGFVYTVIVVRRMRVQTIYAPELEDWLFHVMLPFTVHIAFLILAFVAQFHASEALFGVAGVALLLLFIGIHNAWDNIVYLVFVKKREKADAD